MPVVIPTGMVEPLAARLLRFDRLIALGKAVVCVSASISYRNTLECTRVCVWENIIPSEEVGFGSSGLNSQHMPCDHHTRLRLPEYTDEMLNFHHYRRSVRQDPMMPGRQSSMAAGIQRAVLLTVSAGNVLFLSARCWNTAWSSTEDTSTKHSRSCQKVGVYFSNSMCSPVVFVTPAEKEEYPPSPVRLDGT